MRPKGFIGSQESLQILRKFILEISDKLHAFLVLVYIDGLSHLYGISHLSLFHLTFIVIFLKKNSFI